MVELLFFVVGRSFAACMRSLVRTARSTFVISKRPCAAPSLPLPMQLIAVSFHYLTLGHAVNTMAGSSGGYDMTRSRATAS